MSSPESMTVYCPRCRRETDRLKKEELPVVLFVLIYVAWSHERIVACPECLSKHATMRLWQSIFVSNIFFPIVAISYLGATRKNGPGHELSELELIQYQARPPEFAPRKKPSPLRGVIILLVLLGAVVLTLVMASLSQSP